MAFRFTELALHLLEYKFYDVNGDNAPDLRTLIEENPKQCNSGNSDSKSYLFAINSAENSGTKDDSPVLIKPGSGLKLILEGKRDKGRSLLGEMFSSSSTLSVSNGIPTDNPTIKNHVPFGQIFQEEFAKIKTQMAYREEKFIRANLKFIKQKKIRPEYFLKHFYDSEKNGCIKDGQLLKHIFKKAQFDLSHPRYSHLFANVGAAKHALEKILAKTSSTQNPK